MAKQSAPANIHSCKVCSQLEGKKDNAPAWVVTLQMGLGHMRAAFPLKDIAHGGIVLYGTKETCDEKELKTWKKMLGIYYFFSKAKKIPLIGSFLHSLLDKLEEIQPAYPRTDSSKPDFTAKMTDKFIRAGLCRNIREKVKTHNLPIVSTYFATGIAIDLFDPRDNNYMVVTDTDIARSWAPYDGKKSRIIYCSPSLPATRRLISYGVQPSKIRQTGFPLPKENIGTQADPKILKEDLLKRLVRLDRKGAFYDRMKDTVRFVLKKGLPAPSSKKRNPFTILFAIGGAGAQFEMVEAMLPLFKSKILKGEMKFLLSCGASTYTVNLFKTLLQKIGLMDQFGKSIDVVYDSDAQKYFANFNTAIRNVDIIWTKPSELVFYAGLAIPILCAPCIGPHEHLNQEWVTDLGAGIGMPADVSVCDQWIDDMLDEGRFAQAAWNGFVNVPRNGTFNVEKLVKTGKM